MNKRIKVLDGLFSKWVRFKDKRDYLSCITCKKICPPEDMDAGHYISRSVMSLRFDERNVHPQCRKCNRFQEGLKDEYALELIKLYGPNILEELNKVKWIPKNYSGWEIEAMIKDYRDKLKYVLTHPSIS
jgi:hypothetical protein